MRSLLFLTMLLFITGSSAATAAPTDPDQLDVNGLFCAVNATPPSTISVDENTAIIKRRVECFSQNFSYVRRVKLCMDDYQRDIVATARNNVSGRPEIGLFIKDVAHCPIMYNLCAGQADMKKKDLSRCIQFERQCIDLMLDRYWRGVPLYDNMQLRIE